MERKNWKKTDEKLLEEWSDHGKSFRWMHDRAARKYWKKNIMFQIPVIILSTLTGAANFAQDRISEDYRGYYSLGVGFANIIAGIVATIATFLKVAEYLEAHRVASVSWGKYYHNVKTELQKEPSDREDVLDFMKYAKNEYEKLIEQSPPIPHEIITRLRDRVKDSNFNLPPIVGVFDKFKIGEEEMKEIEKSGIEKVLNVINDDNLVRPESKSNLSRASSMIMPKNIKEYVYEDIEEKVKETVLNIGSDEKED